MKTKLFASVHVGLKCEFSDNLALGMKTLYKKRAGVVFMANIFVLHFRTAIDSDPEQISSKPFELSEYFIDQNYCVEGREKVEP